MNELKVRCYDLRIGNSREQSFLAQARPKISWKIKSDISNANSDAYEIHIARNILFTENFFSTGVMSSEESVNIPWPTEPLLSFQEIYVRVRSRLGTVWSGWSDVLKCETSLLGDIDWPAEFITSQHDLGALVSGPPMLFRKELFLTKAPSKVRIYATAKGIFSLFINGQPASDTFFEPGWTDYTKEFPVKAFDVTDLFQQGDNVIAVVLGDGWFRGKLGWEALRCIYGENIAFSSTVHIENNGQESVLSTDSSWRTNTGHVMSADIYDGTQMDYSKELKNWPLIGFDDTGWNSAKIDLKPKVQFVATTVPPVRVAESITPSLLHRNGGNIHIYDVSRNVTGWVQLKVQGKKGERISVRHSEVLNEDNSLYVRNLRLAKATDTYLLDTDAEITLEPIFTFHGFQYFEVTSNVPILECTVKVIHSDIQERATLNSSHELLNTLFTNIKNSQVSNFISVPTDCPQRDERLGWTGDIATFAKTAVVLYDVQYFLKSWLRQLGHSQLDNGSVTSVVPNVLNRYVTNSYDVGGLMAWGDASTIVPWNIYLSYGDLEVLDDQLSSMTKWVKYLESQQNDTGLLVDESNQIGDWLDPDAPEGEPQNAQVPTLFIMNAFYSHSSLLLSKAHEALGQGKLAEEYLRKSQKIASLTWEKWKSEIPKSMTGCALAIEFNISPETEKNLISEKLVNLIEKKNSRMSTGLIGTSRILPALANSGKIDTAFNLLFNKECPGWMHQVLQGATTIWERWDSKHADGSIDEEPHYWQGKDVGMNSFNHYHLGSIGDWIVQNIGGIGLLERSPGYRKISFSPMLTKEITWCTTSLETPLGTARNSWKLLDDSFEMIIEVPVGAQGFVKIPALFQSHIKIDNLAVEESEFTLQPGTHKINSMRSQKI
jgi:alpha-L-rhamnosidase